MAPFDMERLWAGARSLGVWSGTATFLGALGFLGYRRKAWRNRRRLLKVELRLETAWENTKAALYLSASRRLAAQTSLLADLRSGTAKDRVLSNRSVDGTAQTVQQNKISCDI